MSQQFGQSVCDEFMDERSHARTRFESFHSAHEGYAVLLEEMDELWTEVKNNKDPEHVKKMRAEAIQVGAMILAFVEECCDKNPLLAIRSQF